MSEDIVLNSIEDIIKILTDEQKEAIYLEVKRKKDREYARQRYEKNPEIKREQAMRSYYKKKEGEAPKKGRPRIEEPKESKPKVSKSKSKSDAANKK